ncbi:AfsR/SARP family transcriptional regulator [Tenggerimyces flavus]|uniref:BTAD domain-containing putative transcriptional regulator n=1 Tax=Tenggerimyces flavus TaxID=1708749 RepID=A0ABV7YH46_9ACTN|nr:BTAD domain-containing putative transcriptional regulator [Tenggerimyces flavus]MBM7783898.1 DNA-binding SARP family transcriptional activator [Tenggerimyces flavus]
MDIRLLGPVEARDGDDRVVDLGPRQQRLAFAVLALEVGRAVPVNRFVDLMWPDGPPRTARSSVQVRISGLRGALRGLATVPSSGDGYLLDVDPEAVDAHRFKRLVRQAHQATDDQQLVALLTEATDLWRGPALGGALTDELLRDRLTHGLEEARLGAIEDRIDAELRLGRHTRLLGELTDLVEAHGTRERLVRLHMLASHRAGQTDRALTAARTYRDLLASEYSGKPTSELTDLEQAIRRADPALIPVDVPAPRQPNGAVPPAELPPAVAAFTGRTDDLLGLDELLPNPQDARQTAALAVIAGTAGVGKTSLAVHWSHRVRDHFPDGQLHVDLRGYAPAPALTPHEALAQLLRGLGVDSRAVPVEVTEATALYRSATAGKRVLVLLDNAIDAEQVRPLLPATSGSLCLVTSRDRLSGLVARDGARRILLDTLKPEEATALLDSLLGRDRPRERALLPELAAACAFLPLALRIAAAQLVDDPHRTIADYLVELRSEPLAALRLDGDDAVQRAFELSYQRLGEADRRMFRLLGVIPGPDFTVDTAAALASVTSGDARAQLRRLVAAHLLEQHASQRYRFHDLLREFARARLTSEESAATETFERLLAWYYAHCDGAVTRLVPVHQAPELPPPDVEAVPYADEDAAIGWLEDERHVLLAAVAHCAEQGPYAWACRFANRLRLYASTVSSADELALAEAGVIAADRLDDPVFQARAYANLGVVRAKLDSAAGLPFIKRALEFAQATGDLEEIANAKNNLGLVHMQLGELPVAQELLTECIAMRRQAREPFPLQLLNLGYVESLLGRLHVARDHLAEAAATIQQGDQRYAADTLDTFADVTYALGRPLVALEILDQALDVATSTNNRRAEGGILKTRAAVLGSIGRFDEAFALVSRSLEIASEIRAAENLGQALTVLARIEQRLGRFDASARHYAEAVEASRDGRYHHAYVEALLGQTTGHADRGDLVAADRQARRVLELAQASSYRVCEGDARVALAWTALSMGEALAAEGHARAGCQLHRETGHLLGLAWALAALADALLARGATAEGQGSLREAHESFVACGAAPQVAITTRRLAELTPA